MTLAPLLRRGERIWGLAERLFGARIVDWRRHKRLMRRRDAGKPWQQRARGRFCRCGP